MSWREEYWQSIKSFDTEEKLDLYFYRPIGFLIAKVAKALGITPDQLTITGALLGIASGPLFYRNGSSQSLILGSIFLILAGIFDSSDGQLARMGGGKGSRFGLILDGICDNIVFSAVYAGSILGISSQWGPEIWLIGIVAGFFHSLESSALDYYNREYLYFGYGKVNSDYWNPSNEEARRELHNSRGAERLMMMSRLSWIRQQNKLSTRTAEQRERWRKLLSGPKSSEFQEQYRNHNRIILRAWRLMGPNFHTIMILLFVFARRFDLYLIVIDIIFLPIALLVLRLIQARIDFSFSESLRARGME